MRAWAYNYPDPFHTPQDGHWIGESGCVVLDGLGGHQESEKAVAEALARLQAYHPTGPVSSLELLQTCTQAVKAVQEQHSIDATAAGAALGWDGSDYSVSWSGDCRVWGWDGEWLVLLSEDHDHLWSLAQAGRLDPGAARGLRLKLMDAQTASDAYRLGGGVAKKAFKKQALMHKELSSGYWDTLHLPPNKYETILLTTDGVHDNLGYHELIGLVAECNGERLAQTVAEIAYLYSLAGHSKSKPDDITAVAVSLAYSV